MNSTQQLPKYLYRIYNKTISIDFDIPFLPKLAANTSYQIEITENKDIFNCEFEDGYALDKNKAFYSKNSLIQTCHNKKGRIEYFLNNTLSNYDKAFKLLSHPMALSLFHDKKYVLHSSAVEINNKAYIFLGPSGSGKSYTVNALLKYGKLITEDVLSCFYKNGSFYATPSIPVIKLEKKEPINYVNKFEIEGDTRNRKGYVLNNFDFENTPVKIEGCFILQENEIIHLAKCDDDEAFRNLFLNSFCALPKNQCIQSEKNLLRNISEFISSQNIYKYSRKKNHDINSLLKFLNIM